MSHVEVAEHGPGESRNAAEARANDVVFLRELGQRGDEVASRIETQDEELRRIFDETILAAPGWGLPEYRALAATSASSAVGQCCEHLAALPVPK